MNGRIALLTLLLFVFVRPATAEIYSCTDKDGVRYVADTLMRLPATCRNQAETLNMSDKDKVNYVPAQKQKSGRGPDEFERAVHEVEQKAAQQRQYESRLVQRAEKIAKDFHKAVYQRKEALRNTQYGYRKQVQAADALLQRSRKQKQELLTEVEQARLSTEIKSQINKQLSQVQ